MRLRPVSREPWDPQPLAHGTTQQELESENTHRPHESLRLFQVMSCLECNRKWAFCDTWAF